MTGVTHHATYPFGSRGKATSSARGNTWWVHRNHRIAVDAVGSPPHCSGSRSSPRPAPTARNGNRWAAARSPRERMPRSRPARPRALTPKRPRPAPGRPGESSPPTTGEPGTTILTQATLPPPEGDPVVGGRLVVAGEAEVGAPWTPAAVQCDSYCQMRIRTFIEPLLVTDRNLQLHGFLAESVEPNDDYTEFTIKVREGHHLQRRDTAERRRRDRQPQPDLRRPARVRRDQGHRQAAQRHDRQARRSTTTRSRSSPARTATRTNRSRGTSSPTSSPASRASSPRRRGSPRSTATRTWPPSPSERVRSSSRSTCPGTG